MRGGADAAKAAVLAAEGWTRRFTTMGRRLREMVELYDALGYEVRLEPEDPNDEAPSEVCEQCVVLTLARTIYTRRAGKTGAASEESR
jgi:hypothetical protein